MHRLSEKLHRAADSGSERRHAMPRSSNSGGSFRRFSADDGAVDTSQKTSKAGLAAPPMSADPTTASARRLTIAATVPALDDKVGGLYNFIWTAIEFQIDEP